jgi:predicted DNA binding CopG/RHH family protein
MSKSPTKKKVAKPDDEAIERWLDKTDLSPYIKGAKFFTPKRGRKRIGQTVCLVLTDELIERLKKAGEKRGLGYQTLARMILLENVADYEQ